MRYVMILLVGLTLLAACTAADEPAAELEEQARDVALDCPEPAPCPDCPACPRCEQATCAFGTDPVDLELVGLELLTTAQGAEEGVSYRYSYDEYNSLERATIRFTPRCEGAAAPIRIEVDETVVWEEAPRCGEVHEVPVALNLLDDGRHSIYFLSDVEESYDVDDITLSSEYEDGTSDEQDLYFFTFEEAGADEEEFTTFSDATIRNYVEYEVELDDEDLEREFILSFEGEDRDGDIVILVNDEQVYHGAVSRRENRFAIPGELLDEGTNYLTFVGIGE